MKKILILLAFVATSCGSLGDYTTTIRTGYYSGGPCTGGEYANGIYGFGFYDCYGRLIYNGAYNPVFLNNVYGPRIIITRAPARRVNSASPRGSRGGTKTTRGRRGGSTVRPKPPTPKAQ